MRPQRSTLVLWICAIAGLALLTTAQAQTFTVLHAFDGGQGGANPAAGPTFDRAGNLYGTTRAGGALSYGLVYKLSHVGSGWILSPLYSFRGQEDGAEPGLGSLVIGADGTLYGSTLRGGGSGGGTVYSLRPPAHVCPTVSCPWTLTALHAFGGAGDGTAPNGRMVLDAAGNLYGTTSEGGAGCDYPGCGTVFKLTPSGNGWTETVLYSFMGGNDGKFPLNITMDSAGNIYGVTSMGGGINNAGTLFELSPSGSGYVESLPYIFTLSDGIGPTSVTFDSAGNLIGGSVFGGAYNDGTVFKLSYSNGGWTYTDLHDFNNGYQENYTGPANVMTIDAAGNIYGTTQGTGSYSVGLAFELRSSQGGYTYVDLHDFAGPEDGDVPTGAVVLDSAGNVYSTALGEGPSGDGDVWEITP